MMRSAEIETDEVNPLPQGIPKLRLIFAVCVDSEGETNIMTLEWDETSTTRSRIFQDSGHINQTWDESEQVFKQQTKKQL